jgi:hypothetical protein
MGGQWKNIAVFRGKEIRKTLHKNEWWFVAENVVLALIKSRDPKQYIQWMNQRDPELGKGWVQIVHALLVLDGGGPLADDYPRGSKLSPPFKKERNDVVTFCHGLELLFSHQQGVEF